MTFKRYLVVAGLSLGLSSIGLAAFADDESNRFGISGIAGAVFPVGSPEIRKPARIGPDLGGMLRYGISKNWGIGASYDNMDIRHETRVQPILASALYSFTPDRHWTPTAQVGVGAASANFKDGTDKFDNFAARAGVGLDYFVCPHLAVGPQVTYTFIPETSEVPHPIHAISAGLLLSFFFGPMDQTPAAAPAAAAPAPAPQPVVQTPPTPAPVTVAITPAQVSLSSGQAQAFTATIANATTQAVTWSINPALGSISPTGIYTAPATIALPETVVITATSQADGTKVSTAQVQLVPPTSAPKEVSITINVLFDTAKDVVKPQYEAEIQKVSDFMKSYPSARAEIEGHTDSTGAVDYNTALSQRRADAVKNVLVQKQGIDASRLSAKGYGPTKPIADNKAAAGRAQNRRVVATLRAMTKG